MCELNSLGYELGKLPYVSAMTDVTGFGLLGHLMEMIGTKSLTAVLEKSKISTFQNLSTYTSRFIFPDNTTRNFNAYEKESKGMTDLDFITYCDPQTSGGLLFTVNVSNENEFEAWLKKNDYSAAKVGRVEKFREKKVEFI